MPIVKLAEYEKCRWYISHGMPTSYIAERLNISPVTVRKWRSWTNTDRVFANVVRRALLLLDWQREQLITRLVDARRDGRTAA